MWLKARLEKSIEHEYNKRLADYQRELSKRDRAAMVAELFAEWTASPVDKKRLNQLTWEASLWLPSHIVKALGKQLTYAREAPDPKSVLIAVRKHLWGSSDDVTEGDIIHF